MTTLWIDCETRSDIDISNGVDAYCARGNARVLIVTYAIDDGPVKIWDRPHDDCAPQDLIAALNDKHTTIVAHNARFERTVFSHTGLSQAPLNRWLCTMAMAYAHGLPASLEALGRFLGLNHEQQKLADGKQLIRLFCTPPFADPREHVEEWVRFCEYAKQDVETMRLCYQRMPKVNYPKRESEYELWLLDQRINDRGFAVDTDLAERAIAALAAENEELGEVITAVTGGHITRGTQAQRIKEYLQYVCGVDLPDMQKGTIADYLAQPGVPDDVATILNIRRDAGRSSTSKYRTLLSSEVDGRLRGTAQYCGADRTGRWAGRIFQPLNLPRPAQSADVVELEIAELKAGRPPLFYDSEHARCADALRGCIIAPKGKRLAVADWNAIEGRLLAWAADETWVLDAYRDGRDMYIETYAKTFGVGPFAKKDPRRQQGKALDLGMGYQGGVGAAMTMTKTYGVDHVELAENAWDVADAEVRDSAHWMWDEWAIPRGQTFDLAEPVYLGLQCAKILWRNARPKTVALWRALENAARDAIVNRGTVFHAGKCQFFATASVLTIKLPSGRLLFYWHPRLRDEVAVDTDGEPIEDAKPRKVITYVDSRGGRRPLYGGLIAENITQANSREILAWSMPRLEAAGYAIVMTVYDEVVAEAEDHERMCRIMEEPPSWAPDLPLAVEGYTSSRYRKD